MKKTFGIYGIMAVMILMNQSDIFAQTASEPGGLSAMMKIELIVVILIIGTIFVALMRDFPESETTEVIASGSVGFKPATVKGLAIDVRFEKMINAAIISATALSVIYLIVIIMMLSG